MLHALDDHRVSGNGRGHVLRLDFLRIEDRDDLFGDRRGVHDGAVHDRVLRQRLEAETHQLVALFRLLQLDGLHRTRADIQADQRFRFSQIEHRAAPHSSLHPASQDGPSFSFAYCFRFAFLRKPRLAAASARPTTPYGAQLAAHREYCESRYVPLSSVYCIRAHEVSSNVFSCVLW